MTLESRSLSIPSGGASSAVLSGAWLPERRSDHALASVRVLPTILMGRALEASAP
jgi:hypothetical protein